MNVVENDANSAAEVQVVAEGVVEDPRFRRLTEQEIIQKKGDFKYPEGFCEVPPALRVKTGEYLNNYIMGVETIHKDR